MSDLKTQRLPCGILKQQATAAALVGVGANYHIDPRHARATPQLEFFRELDPSATKFPLHQVRGFRGDGYGGPVDTQEIYIKDHQENQNENNKQQHRYQQ